MANRKKRRLTRAQLSAGAVAFETRVESGLMLPGKLRVFNEIQVPERYPIKHRHYRATILHYIVGSLNQEFNVAEKRRRHFF